MYRPSAFDVADEVELLDLVERAAFGHLVTIGEGGFDATGLPLLVDRQARTLRGHVARANPQWRTIDGAPSIVLFPLADGYVSPSWYPSKAVDGRVVPTWNYEIVHVHGVVRIQDDASWIGRLVADLTDRHEAERNAADRWSVTDAPADFIDRQLRAIVGVEIDITSIEGKRKLSQNRSDVDRAGVADAFGVSPRLGDRAIADAMRAGS
jgi:transcriptional regulator